MARLTVAVLGLRLLWKLRDVVEESLYVVRDKRVRIVWRTFGYASRARRSCRVCDFRMIFIFFLMSLVILRWIGAAVGSRQWNGRKLTVC